MCWIGIIPEKSDNCSYKRNGENGRFARVWNEHYIEIIRKNDIPRNIRKKRQSKQYHCTCPRRETIYPIGDICSVRNCRYNENHHRNENYPRPFLSILLIHPEKNFTVIKFIIFNKWNRGNHGFLFGREFSYHAVLCMWQVLYLSFDNHSFMEIHRYPHNKPQTYLTNHLEFTAQAVFILLDFLQIIINETNRPHPKHRNHKENDINIM